MLYKSCWLVLVEMHHVLIGIAWGCICWRCIRSIQVHIALGAVCISSSISYLSAGIKLQHPFSLWTFITILNMYTQIERVNGGI